MSFAGTCGALHVIDQLGVVEGMTTRSAV